MTWSTRQLAELAGTSVRAVRHYHDIGLLAEPERASNGYKRYGVAHLLRVLRIKRLADLGIPLSQIAEMGDGDDFPRDALQTLDAELATTIERLQRIRVELALILRQGTHTDLPPDIGSAAQVLTDADRAFTLVLTRVLGPSGMSALRDLLNNQREVPAMTEFDNLPADADESTRAELAHRIAPYAGTVAAEYPEIAAPAADSPVGPKRAAEAVGKALRDLYNPAQLDVLVKVNRLLYGPDGQQPAKDRRTGSAWAVAVAAGPGGSPHKAAADGSIALSSATGAIGHVLADVKAKEITLTGKNVADLADQVLPALTAAMTLLKRQGTAEADNFRGTVLVAVESATRSHKAAPAPTLVDMTRKITAALDAA